MSLQFAQIAVNGGFRRAQLGGNLADCTVPKNIQAILAQQEMTLANVVKTTVFLADINDFAEMNKVYGEYFAQPYPARSAVQVGKLPKDAPLEIECIAVK